MKWRFNVSFGPVAALFLLTIAAIATAADSEGVAHSYKLKIDSRLVNVTRSKKQKIDAKAEYSYTWRQVGSEYTLSMDGTAIKENVDGKEELNSTSTRTRFTNTVDGKTEEIAAETAPEALKSILHDSFGVPICKVERDETGKETKRTIVAGPGAKILLDNGVISNAVMFHPPFLADRDEWQADSEMNLGENSYARGKFTYKKAANGKVVKVSGVLVGDATTVPNTTITTVPRCTVSGEETYDPARHDWVAGKLVLAVAYDMVDGNKTIGSSKGTVTLIFERLADKPAHR